MFSFLKKEASPHTPSPRDYAENAMLEFDDTCECKFEIEVGGSKGWPRDASFILYHKIQGLICVGTECGSVFVYGDGFQFMRPCLTLDSNPVQSIASLHPNRIIVLFKDDSLVIMELPTLDIVHLLEPTWLITSKTAEDTVTITEMYVDVPSEKNLIYVGTSNGYVHVLDATLSTLRICDYRLHCSDFGISHILPIVDIKVCPKDEKFLAVAFSEVSPQSNTSDGGFIGIFDLSKHKVFRMFNTPVISCLVWHHHGETLFLSTLNGKLFSVLPERNTCVEVWDAREELVNVDCVAEEEDGEEVVPISLGIKRISWMAPQSSGREGCLFALLDSDSCAEMDDLSSVIVGLSAQGDFCHEVKSVFKLPPLEAEKVLAFRVVPSYDVNIATISNPTGEEASSVSTSAAPVTPAILMLCEKVVGDNTSRVLRIARCPARPAVADWVLDIGSMPAPRLAVEVLPALSPISCLVGFVAVRSPQSIAAALLSQQVLSKQSQLSSTTSATAAAMTASEPPGAIGVEVSSAEADGIDVTPAEATPDRNKRRFSLRGFLLDNSEGVAAASTWEMVLAHGLQPSNFRNTSSTSSSLPSFDAPAPAVADMVVMGHIDGSLIVWGVSLPVSGSELGRGNLWLPLQVLRCGHSAIVTVAHDEEAGLLLAADSEGLLVVWELYDSDNKQLSPQGLGSVQLLSKIYSEAVDIIAQQCEKRSQQSDGVVEESDDSRFIDDFAQYWYRFYKYRPSSLRQLIRCQLPSKLGKVTCALLLSNVLSAVVGTEFGVLLYFSDLRIPSFSKIDIELDRFDAAGFELGAAVSMCLSTFYLYNKLIPAVYCTFSSGHLIVLELRNWSILFLSTGRSIFNGSRGRNTDSDAGGDDDEDDGNYHHNKGKVAAVDDASCIGQSVDVHVLNSSRRPLSKPDLISICRYRLVPDVPVDNATVNTSSPTNQASVNKTAASASRLSLLFSRSKSDSTASSTTTATSSPSLAVPPAQPSVPEEHIARYVVLVRDNRLVTYHLQQEPKFAANSASSPSSDGGMAGGMYLSQPLRSMLTQRTLHKGPIVASKFMMLSSKSEPCSSHTSSPELSFDPAPPFASSYSTSSFTINPEDKTLFALASISSLGSELIVSAVRAKPVIVHRSSLLDGVVDEELAPIEMEAGVVLANGNCFMLQRGGSILFNAAAVCHSHSFSQSLPDRGSVQATQPPSKTQLLLHGREAVVEKASLALKKRRSSVMSLASGPTDLFKIFSKTRDALQKDDLLGESSDSVARSRTSSSSAVVTSATTSASLATSAARELAVALEERGEKLKQLAAKSDQIKDGSSDFKASTNNLTDKLKKKNNRWGLF